MAASSLTGIFAPGSPTLVEALRTLTVEPSGSLAPGDTVRATFSFSNNGGAAATGVRVRFSHPVGVDHVADGDTVDERPLDAGESFISPAGASVGDLDPNGARRVTCTFRVNEIIEDTAELHFQAALVTDQTSITGSNVERRTVRSRPELRNSSTLVTLVTPASLKPGDQLTVRATVRNTGSSSAHDVSLVLPAPEHTRYVARSARIDGRVVSEVSGEAFDYDTGALLSERLAPGQSVVAEYVVTVDSPLPDGTRIRALGSVGARECAEVELRSAEAVVSSPVDFSGEETAFDVASDDTVTPGTRVPMTVRAINTGTGIAHKVSVAFRLPDGLIYSPGSAAVDGQAVADDSIADMSFSLGSLASGRAVEVSIAATVAVPSAGRTELPIAATLRWSQSRTETAERQFSRRLSVRVAPRFSRARNFVEADRGVAQAREDVDFFVHVYNDGTAAQSEAYLRLTPGLYLSDIRVGENADELYPHDDATFLGVVQPHEERIVLVRARVASRVPDRATVALGAVLEAADESYDLGAASVVVRSRPTIGEVTWELASHEPLRPNRTTDVIVRVRNDGSDVLRDARLSLTLPPELSIERTVDARRDRNNLTFVDIPAESTHEARVTLRLTRAVANNRDVRVEAWMHGKGVSPAQFVPLDIPTFAQASFESTSSLHAIPAERVNAGERLYYEIRLRNEGDGPADRLVVRVVPTNLAVYLPGSTTINGMPIVDDSGASQLWAARGLILADVDPYVDVRIRWEMMVMSPLPAETPIDSRAILEWADGASCALAAPTVHVVAVPTLSESASGTPISIARLLETEAPTTLETVPVVPAVPPPLPKMSPAPEPVAEPAPAVVTDAPVAPAPAPQVAAFEPEIEEPEPEDAALEPASAELEPASAALEPAVEAPVEDVAPRAIAEIVEAHADRLAPPAHAEPIAPPAHGVGAPVLYIDFGAERLTNTLRVLERSDSAGGLVQHLFALRMLLPEAAVGAPADLASTFASASRTLRAPLEKLFVRLRMPRLAITGKDIEDRESRDAMRTMLEDLELAPTVSPQAPPSGIVRLSGAIDVEVVRSLLPELEAAPIGAAVAWLINAQLLATTMYRDDTQSDTLEGYRAELLAVLTVLNELPLDEFHRVITTSVNRKLDDALQGVLSELRGAVRIAAE